MDYKTMRNQIEDMVNNNHKDFVKAVISIEKGISDESTLDKIYEAYMAVSYTHLTLPTKRIV